MARFVAGEIVVVPFPFSDLSLAKRRPALVVKPLFGNDAILCRITSRSRNDRNAIPLSAGDFSSGRLRHPSHIRPDRLFTCDGAIVLYSVGLVSSGKHREVVRAIIELLSTP
ncbi:MAG: type II toxin-antitoxin system PemK/MazF family toxin [Trueperaceae bacterium]|nr:MAG: type II toxin-antitoxin system PemK/MazF family toxin [Trueperaceae bacterium]